MHIMCIHIQVQNSHVNSEYGLTFCYPKQKSISMTNWVTKAYVELQIVFKNDNYF